MARIDVGLQRKSRSGKSCRSRREDKGEEEKRSGLLRAVEEDVMELGEGRPKELIEDMYEEHRHECWWEERCPTLAVDSVDGGW